MGFAHHAATASKDSTKVGAALSRDRRLLCTAYNGPPMGVDDLESRRERPAKYLFAAHAEENIVALAARFGVDMAGADLFVTHHPCAACARMIIQSGVARVFFGNGQTNMPDEHFFAAAAMFKEAGVKIMPVVDEEPPP